MSTAIAPETIELTRKPFVAPTKRKKWLVIQPKSNTPLMVDSGKVSMPLNLLDGRHHGQHALRHRLPRRRIGDEIPRISPSTM